MVLTEADSSLEGGLLFIAQVGCEALCPADQGALGMWGQGPGEETSREGLGGSWLWRLALPGSEESDYKAPSSLKSTFLLILALPDALLQMLETEAERRAGLS